MYEKFKENDLHIQDDYWAKQENWSLSSVFQERYNNQLKFIKNAFLPFLSREQQVCDLASANGEWSLWLAKYVAHVDGFEYSMPMVHTARENSLRQGITNVEFRQADACGITFDKQYDNFMMMGLLTCILSDRDAEYIVGQVYNSIKTGGRLVIKDTLNTIEDNIVYLYNSKNGYHAAYRSKNKYYNIFKKLGFKFEQDTVLETVTKDFGLGFCSLGSVWVK